MRASVARSGERLDMDRLGPVFLEFAHQVVERLEVPRHVYPPASGTARPYRRPWWEEEAAS